MNRLAGPLPGRTLSARALLVLLVLLSVVPLGATTVVVVGAGEPAGLGLAEGHEGDCLVITAAHLLDGPTAAGEQPIPLVGPRGIPATALFEQRVGDEFDDLVLLRVDTGAAAICSDGERESFRNRATTEVVIRRTSGKLAFLPAEILYESDLDLEIALSGEDGRLGADQAGAVVIENGRLKGIVTSIDASADGRVASGRHIDFLVERLGGWLRDPLPMVEVQRALDVLKRAVEQRPTGDIGQVAALELLVSGGISLAGRDFAGLSFDGAAIDGVDLDEIDLTGGRFLRAILRRAKLRGAKLEFARINEAQAEGAHLAKALLYFAIADHAILDDALLASSNWTAASARGASFRGADLTGANFKFADLTGADFTGADLTETQFNGAILTDAIFTGATVKNTDLTSASGDATQFTPAQQKELCSTPFVGPTYGRVELYSTTPSSTGGLRTRQLSSGYFDYLMEIWRLDRCGRRPRRAAGLDSDRYDFYYPTALLSIGQREATFVARFDDQLRRLEAAVAAGRFVEVAGEQRHGLTATLERSRQATEPLVDEVPITHDVPFLLALRHQPALVDQESWRGYARAHLDGEGRRARGNDEKPALWPRFFPEGTIAEVLSPEHVERFKEWTHERASQLPDLFRLEESTRSHVASISRAWRRKYDPEPPASIEVLPLSELKGRSLPDYLVEALGGEVHGYQEGGGWSLDGGALIFDQPLEHYRLDLPADFVAALGKRLAVELRIRVRDVQVLEVETGKVRRYGLPPKEVREIETWGVVSVDLVGMRLIDKATGAAYPEQLASSGTIQPAKMRTADSKSDFIAKLCAHFDIQPDELVDLRYKIRPDLSTLPWPIEADPHADSLATQQRIMDLIEKYRPYRDILSAFYLEAAAGGKPDPQGNWALKSERVRGGKGLLERPEICR